MLIACVICIWGPPPGLKLIGRGPSRSKVTRPRPRAYVMEVTSLTVLEVTSPTVRGPRYWAEWRSSLNPCASPR
jgi:hypothetical protein